MLFMFMHNQSYFRPETYIIKVLENYILALISYLLCKRSDIKKVIVI